MSEQGADSWVSLSVVIPLFNEAESLLELYSTLDAAVAFNAGSSELIFVDDGSTDGSFEILEGLRSKDERVKVVQLRGHQGKSAALAVGFREASGE